MTEPILVAKNGKHELHLLPQMSNRHGLITGATGTGKTVTLQTLAESFSRIGVPVFMSDIKGDLSGVSKGRRRQYQDCRACCTTQSGKFRTPSLSGDVLGCIR